MRHFRETLHRPHHYADGWANMGIQPCTRNRSQFKNHIGPPPAVGEGDPRAVQERVKYPPLLPVCSREGFQG